MAKEDRLVDVEAHVSALEAENCIKGKPVNKIRDEEAVTNCDGERDQVGKLKDNPGESRALPESPAHAVVARVAVTDAEDADLLTEDVIDAFLTDTPAQLINLRTLLAEEDLEGVRRVAHYLKGSAMYLGLQRMHELCHGIEMLTVLSGVQDAGDVVPLLEAEFARVRDELIDGKREAAKSKAAGGQ
jgi:HPt (histidine-containing phosphotransfer) domain-containing protein